MIHLFSNGRKLFHFPKGWANSVTRWIGGIYSPEGTIKIGNTMSPGDDGSMSLDVNIEMVTEFVCRILQTRELTKADRERVRDVVSTCIDHDSLMSRDGEIYVRKEWIKEIVNQLFSDGFADNTDFGESSEDDVLTTSESDIAALLTEDEWIAGGNSGIEFDAYCTIYKKSTIYYLQRFHFKVSRFGWIKSIKKVGGIKKIRS